MDNSKWKSYECEVPVSIRLSSLLSFIPKEYLTELNDSMSISYKGKLITSIEYDQVYDTITLVYSDNESFVLLDKTDNEDLRDLYESLVSYWRYLCYSLGNETSIDVYLYSAVMKYYSHIMTDIKYLSTTSKLYQF